MTSHRAWPDLSSIFLFFGGRRAFRPSLDLARVFLPRRAGASLPSPPVGEGGLSRCDKTDEGCWKKRDD